MSRIRTFRPDIWRHPLLLRLWRETGIPVLPVYMGLWNHADSLGRLRLDPDQLALDILPGLGFDMASALKVLCDHGLIVPYTVEGRAYCFVPAWDQWMLDAKELPVHPPPSPALEALAKTAAMGDPMVSSLDDKNLSRLDDMLGEMALGRNQLVVVERLRPNSLSDAIQAAGLKAKESNGSEEAPEGVSFLARVPRHDWRDRMGKLVGWRTIFTESELPDLWWLDRVRELRAEAMRDIPHGVNEGTPKLISLHFQRICRSGLATAPELYCAFRLYLNHQKAAGWVAQGKVMGLVVFFGTGAKAMSPWEGWVERARPRMGSFLPLLRRELGALPGDDAQVGLELVEGGEGAGESRTDASVAPGPGSASPCAAPGPLLPPLSGLDGPLPGLENVLRPN